MRVLMLTADFPPTNWSGVGVAVEHRAEALAGLGIKVDVLVSDDLTPLAPTPPSGHPDRFRVFPLTRDRFPVDPKSYDLIHLHSLRLAPLALELQRRARRPLVTTVHGLPHLELGNTDLARRWAKIQAQVLTASDRVIFLSRAEAAIGKTWLPAIAQRCRVVAHGLPPAPRCAAEPTTTVRPFAARSPDAPVVFAGRFTAGKGIDLVHKLVASSQRRWVVAGGRPDQAGKQMARRLKQHPRCWLPGWLPRPRLNDILSQAQLVVVPSRYEPFGLLALEAMAVGTPVLAADVGGLRDTIRRHSGGRRCQSRSPRVWTKQIEALLESGEAETLGHRGPTWVANCFDRDQQAVRLLQHGYGQTPVSLANISTAGTTA